MRLYLDADVFLALLKEEDRHKVAATLFLEKYKEEELFTSAITCMELWFYLYRESRNKMVLDSLRAVSMLCTVVDVGFSDMQEAALLSEHYGLSPADALHAHIALRYDAIVSSDHSFDKVSALKRMDFSRGLTG